jgi:hypothetical protein
MKHPSGGTELPDEAAGEACGYRSWNTMKLMMNTRIVHAVNHICFLCEE